jgi:enamine deaminase RidA (YjgF/YER057c/UK114 family)
MKNVLRLLVFLLLAACNTQLDRAPKEEKGAEKIQQVDVDYDPEAKLEALGIRLSAPSSPVANYVHVVRTGNLLFLAGKGPRKADGTYITGKLGADLTVEQGYEAARLTGVNQLSVLKAELGNLNKVKRIVKVLGMVNAVPEFTDHPEVINGFSDFMVEVFGEKGKHARAAVGMASLPRNTAVEIEMIVEIEE